MTERRREIFQICMIWKMSQGMIEGYDIRWSHSERRGRFAVPNPAKNSVPARIRTARERSLRVHGVKLFNMLPSHLRDENSGDYLLFKNHLEIFLKTIPDEPTSPGLHRAAATNSLIDQIPLVLRENY